MVDYAAAKLFQPVLPDGPYLKITYGYSAGVRNYISQRIVQVTKMSPPLQYVKIYRPYRRMRSSSANQKDYRLVIIIVISSYWPTNQ